MLSSRQQYIIDTPGYTSDNGEVLPRETIHFDGFHPFHDEDVRAVVGEVLANSVEKAKGVVVTASVLTAKNYEPVLNALNLICKSKDSEQSGIGDVYLIACENTVSAYEVLQHKDLASCIQEETHRHTRCVHALVDRRLRGDA